jgi:uncharacterized protein (TIGR02118 family)
MAAAVIVYGTSDSMPDHLHTNAGQADWRLWTAAASHDPLSTGHDDTTPRWALTGLTDSDAAAGEAGAGLRAALAGHGMTLQVMDEHRYVVGEDQRGIHDCPVAYFVVYHGPAADPAAFIDHYLDHHVPTMARLPEIQAMSIFTPQVLQPGGKPGTDLLVCQVGFDSVDLLNAALASPVRQELRQGAGAFPPFKGPPVHQAMVRSVLPGD